MQVSKVMDSESSLQVRKASRASAGKRMATEGRSGRLRPGAEAHRNKVAHKENWDEANHKGGLVITKR